MKRKELKRYTESEIEEIDDALLEASEDGIIKMTRAYIASEADSVMDAMEARIKELESQLENVQSSMYAENVDANMSLVKANERIKELENKNKNLQYSSDMWMACCKLMSEGKRNVMSSDAIAEMQRIKGLEAENARLNGELKNEKYAHERIREVKDVLKAENAELKRKLYVNDGETTRLLNRINNFKTDEANVQNILNDCYVMLHKQMSTISILENNQKESN